jgi:peptidoglycan hydrolase CwlO-like protein
MRGEGRLGLVAAGCLVGGNAVNEDEREAQLTRIERVLGRIDRGVKALQKGVTSIMANEQDLQASIDALGGSVGTIEAGIAQLESEVGSGNVSQADLDALAALKARLDAAVASIPPPAP